MSEKQAAIRPRHALLAALSAGLSVGLLAALPIESVDADVGATFASASSSCAARWSAAGVYVGGDTVSESGVNFRANWWTQGNEPATYNGGAGTGEPWTSQGTCK